MRSAKWYRKTSLTFADAIAAVRRQMWAEAAFTTSPAWNEASKIPGPIYNRLIDLASYAA